MIFVHQLTYTEKRFYMDKAHPLNILIQVRSLDVKKDIFRPRDDNEELIGPGSNILVQFVHLCILLIIQHQILHFQ